MGPVPKSSRSRGIVRDTLVAVVRDPAMAAVRMGSLDPGHLDLVLEHGTAQKLGTAIAACLRRASLPVPDWLEAHRFKTAVRRAIIMSTLAQVAPALNKSDIPWAVLKGPVTATTFASPYLREFGDLDILVPGRRLPEVLEVFSRVGIDDQNHNWGAYVRYGVAEFPVFIGGATIDLHWHLIGLASTRKRFSIDVDDLLSRRQSVLLEGTDCFRLDTEDHLGHVALHAGLAGGGNLGLLRDVHETIRASDIDWPELIVRSSAKRTGPLVGQVLDRSRLVLGTAMPTGIPEDLAPRSALAVRRSLDRRAHPWGVPSQTAFSGFMIGASRSGLVSSAKVAGEMLRGRAAIKLGHPRQWSASDPDGLLYWNRRSNQNGSLEDYMAYAELQT